MFRPTLSSPDLPDCPSGRTCNWTLGSVMIVVMVVKASRPGRHAGRDISWDSRDTNDNQGGNRNDSSKRHDHSSLRLLGLISYQTQRL
jgi:hypothetical protein